MARVLGLVLTMCAICVMGCSQKSAAPPKVELTQDLGSWQFSIRAPEAWKELNTTQHGEDVTIGNPADEEVYVNVFTQDTPAASRDHAARNYRFDGHQPKDFVLDNGRTGIVAEVQRSDTPGRTTIVMAVWGRTFEHYVEAVTPTERLSNTRHVLEAMLKSFVSLR